MPKGRGSNERRRNQRLERKAKGTQAGTLIRNIGASTFTISNQKVGIMSRVWNRIKNEPVLLGTVGVAIANLFFSVGPELESSIIVIVGAVVRHFVTPTRKSNGQ